MDQFVPIQISAACMLINIALFLQFIWRKRNFTATRIQIHPYSFLLFFFVIFGLAGALTLVLGFENGALALAFAAGIVFSLVHPALAVSFLVSNLMLRPWELLPDNDFVLALPRFLAGLSFFSWLLYSFNKKKLSFVWNDSCTLFTLFIIWLFLSAAFSGDIAEGASYVQTSFLPIIVLAFLVLNSVSESTDLKILQNTLLCSIIGVICIALYLSLSSADPRSIEFRLVGIGFMGNANDLASLIVLALPLVLFSFFLKTRSKLCWVVGGVCLGVLLVALWLSKSRAALVALVVSGVGYFLFCGKALKKKLILGLLLCVLPLVLYKAINREAEDLAGSTTSRWNYVITGFKMLKDNPIFGVGVGNYPKKYDSYSSLYYEWGERTAHSSWVLVMSETGAVGLLLFGGLYLTTLAACWRIRKEMPEFFVTQLGYGVSMSFLSHSYIFLPYLVFALSLAASRVNRSENRQRA